MRILDGRDNNTYKIEFMRTEAGYSTNIRVSWQQETSFVEPIHLLKDLAHEIKINNTKILQIDSDECHVLVRTFFNLL